MWHGEGGRSVSGSVQWALDTTYDLAQIGRKKEPKPIKIAAVWNKPDSGTLKIAVDASFNKEDNSGVRDSDGLLIQAQAKWTDFAANSLVLEAVAILEGIRFAIDRGFLKVEIESDALEVIKLIEDPEHEQGVSELFGMLKAAEIEIKKEHQVLMVNKTTSFKKQGKSKGKFKKGGKKAATPPMKPKNGPKPDADCYYCKEKGHWKRNLRSEERPCQEEERRSTRDRATPDWYDPCLNVMIVDNNDEDPATYEEAMMSQIPTNGKKP
ncbi:hypothetical protein QYE76_036158 [Lolium multiflorum]|uniref:RNase H type-1 domain-containing protein n=1 Tax=Lolium multiflorum TaxID=4521 RepID=A0AAD8VPP9_LOLMU|nr:hypothetical protein QYE76_036158 [Lolium multiflorum]